MTMRRSAIIFFVGILIMVGSLIVQLFMGPISRNTYTPLSSVQQLQTDEILFYNDKAVETKIAVPLSTEDLDIALHKNGTYKLYAVTLDGKNVAVISQIYKLGRVYAVGPAVSRSVVPGVDAALSQYEAAAGIAFEDRVLIDTEDSVEKRIGTISTIMLIVSGVIAVVSFITVKRRNML